MEITGNDLKKWRVDKDMSRSDLAVLSKCSHKTIENLEQRGLNPLPQNWQGFLSSGQTHEVALRVVMDLEVDNADQ